MAKLEDLSIYKKHIIPYIPEIHISDKLAKRIMLALEEEEDQPGCAQFFESTTRVQIKTSFNKVFFANQWWCLAVFCKGFAEALLPYIDFYDKQVRTDKELVQLIDSHNLDSDKIKNLLPDSEDRERFYKFFIGDEEFCDGKSAKNSEGKGRPTKDVFGSRVLKKIDVPDSSSGYLGDLIFYLSKNAELYNDLEKEVQPFIPDNVVLLNSDVRAAAKDIIDYIYDLDKCQLISGLFKKSDKLVKIDTSAVNDILPNKPILESIFVLPESTMNNTKTKRFYEDDEYYINIDGFEIKCYFTTQWKGTDYDDPKARGNYFKALIEIVNRYYSKYIEIVSYGKEYYIIKKALDFSYSDMPDAFQNDFAKRYINALLAKPFVILTGNSGTGKTRISKLFSKYMKVSNSNIEKNYLIVPVGADWTDNTKVLGFYNPLEKKYVSTPLLEFILLADRNPTVPFFLILDEMNLSHVERYFSDFLSAMESDEEIPLYKREINSETGDIPLLTIPEKIRIPENLFVTGTVNIDETTYMFSPKVLDRANVIEFITDEDDVLGNFFDFDYQKEITPAKEGIAESFLCLSKEIRDGKCRLNNDHLTKAKNVFEQVYNYTEPCGFEFAYRTVKEIRQYMSVAFELADDWDEQKLYSTIDEQLLQKILPKIHGNKKEIDQMLKDLKGLCEQDGKTLTKSKKKIEKMMVRLEKVNYASFI